jgi:hypothetical protein
VSSAHARCNGTWSAPISTSPPPRLGRVNLAVRGVGFVCCVSAYPTREPKVMAAAGRRDLDTASGDIVRASDIALHSDDREQVGPILVRA